MRHLHGHEVRYWARDKWICDGDLHEHLSREAAEKCELNPKARDSRGWRRGEREQQREQQR